MEAKSIKMTKRNPDKDGKLPGNSGSLAKTNPQHLRS
jgi:hypothetical protein